MHKLDGNRQAEQLAIFSVLASEVSGLSIDTIAQRTVENIMPKTLFLTERSSARIRPKRPKHLMFWAECFGQNVFGVLGVFDTDRASHPSCS